MGKLATKLRTDRSRETLWQIIIKGKSVLYFKGTGKLKVTSWQAALNFI